MSLGRLTRLMKKYTVSHSVTAAPAAARMKVNRRGSLLKLGLDIHREKFVVAAQYDHATPRPPQRFAPAEFLPDEKEERARHWSRQREQLVHHRQKMEAQGRGLLVSHGLPAPAHWWKLQNWNRLGKLLPAWILPHLELYRPALLAFDQQVRALFRSSTKYDPLGRGACSQPNMSPLPGARRL